MRLSEFRHAVDGQFGHAYGEALLRDLVIPALGGRSVAEALAAGVPPRDAWLALCEEMDVPENKRHGVGRPDPKR